MLVFIFSALIVALDQFFKHYITRTLEIGERGPEIIPGVLALTRWENDGAMLNILSGQQWLLAGIAFVAAVVLIMILLRYDDGFWGTLGLASVLGGTVGNLIDRVFNDGAVVDMFRTLFINFPIFNFADIFITLGFATFIVHLIALSIREARGEKAPAEGDEYEDDEYYEEEYEKEHDEQGRSEPYDEFPEIDSMVAAQAEQEIGSDYSGQEQYTPDIAVAATDYTAFVRPTHAEPIEPQVQYAPVQTQTPETEIVLPDVFDTITDVTPDIGFSLDDLEVDLSDAADYDVDELLREYGLSDDD